MRRKLEPRGPLGIALHDLMSEARRLEIKAFADAAGVTRQTVYKILKGDSTSVDTLHALADALAKHPLTGALDPVFRARAWERLMTAAGGTERPSRTPRPDPEPTLTDEERRLLQAFRGRLRPMRDFMVQAADLEEADRRLVLDAVAWAFSHIEAVKAWADARQATIGAQQDAQQIALERSAQA